MPGTSWHLLNVNYYGEDTGKGCGKTCFSPSITFWAISEGGVRDSDQAILGKEDQNSFIQPTGIYFVSKGVLSVAGKYTDKFNVAMQCDKELWSGFERTAPLNES